MEKTKWRARSKDGHTYLYDYDSSGLEFIFDLDKIKTETISKFTGYCDCKEREVYEGDIIRLKFRTGDTKIFLVCYNDMLEKFTLAHLESLNQIQSYGYIFSLDWWRYYKNDIEIIGNRYDNPEMMEKCSLNRNTRKI